MKRVLVTGAAGFIGSHIVDSLLDLGFCVFAIDILKLNEAQNLSEAKLNKNFSYHEIDITAEGALDPFFEEKIEKVYHYASVVGVEKYLNTPEEVIRVNVIGTQNIVKLVMKHKVDIVFASTSEVYGKNPKVPWSEEDNRVLGSTSFERWTYSTSKATAEHLLMAYLKNSDVNWIIVRYFNVYGPRQNANFVVSSNLKNYILKKPLLCHNDGNQTRCYSYIADIVDATIKLADGSTSGIYNIGSDVEVTINELLVLINNVADYKEEVLSINTDDLLGDGFEDILRRVPDTSKIQNEINWKPNTPLAEGLNLTYNWMNKNQWWLQQDM